MGRALWLPQVLRSVGLEVIEYATDGIRWDTHGSVTFNPRGMVWHHTATSDSWADGHVAHLLAKGRRDLPGPLSQLGLDRDGAWWVIASGRANHAGVGGWRGLSGNTSVMGLEVFNDGVGEPWTPVQYESAVIGTRAILRKLGIGTEMLCAHREWTTRKIDPTGIDMDRARHDVAAMSVVTPEAGEDSMGPGSKRKGDVGKLQVRLNQVIEAGKLDVEPLKVDGDYGTKTTGAMVEFQKSHGLTADGVASVMAVAHLQLFAHGLGSH